MKTLVTGAVCAVVVLAGGMAAFAQTTAPSAPPQQTSTQAQAPATTPQPPIGGSIMVAGCVQREGDYRRAQSKGKGGVVGTGVGADNEYVLISATLVPAPSSTPPATIDPAAPTGTSGTEGTDAYEVTGPNEAQLSAYVGKRVEISGKVKSVQTGSGISVRGGVSGGTATGSVSTGGGVDVLGQDLNLKELEITTVREIPGSCAPLAK